MRFELFPANAKEHDTLLRNLYQFYIYEFAHIIDIFPQDNGKYHEHEIADIWENPSIHILLLYIEFLPAGFAIIEETIADTDQPPFRFMREFFVMAPLQRQGIGERFARACFDQFPGKWKVTEILPNKRAISFWNAVIERYTGKKPYEVVYQDREVVAQYFDSTDLQTP